MAAHEDAEIAVTRPVASSQQLANLSDLLIFQLARPDCRTIVKVNEPGLDGFKAAHVSRDVVVFLTSFLQNHADHGPQQESVCPGSQS